MFNVKETLQRVGLLRSPSISSPEAKPEYEPYSGLKNAVGRRTISLPGNITSTAGSYPNRYPYSPWYEIELAERLYAGNAFTKYMVNTAVEFAIGGGPTGLKVIFDSEDQTRLFEDWKPLYEAPWADYREVLRTALVSLIVSGEIFIEFLGDDKLVVLPSKFFRTAPHGEGVVLDGRNRPVEYIYNPLAHHFWGWLPHEAETIPPDRMLHIYRKIIPQSYRGISWLRPSIEHLQGLENMNAENLRSVLNQLKAASIITFDEEVISDALGDTSAVGDGETEGAGNSESDAQALVLPEIYGTMVNEYQAGNVRGLVGVTGKMDVLNVENPTVDSSFYDMSWGQRAALAALGMGVSPNLLLGWNAKGGYSGNATTANQDKRFFNMLQSYAKVVLNGLIDYYNPGASKPKILMPNFPALNPLHDIQNVVAMVNAGIITPEKAAEMLRVNY